MSVGPDRSSLAARALWTLALFVGFYVLALGLAGLFFWIPWAESRYAGHVGWSGIACGIVGAWFLYAILPGWPPRAPDRPPPLADDAHPRLRALIREVAEKTGERPPDVVYLLADANAFTAREGGFLGFGQKHVVGIGLPLVSHLSTGELRAVLAHEFGHHRGGDLRLGPFVHRTRMAVARAISRLDGSSFLLHWPFLLYGRFFLRVSRQISREQELAADALSAQVAGAEIAGSALTRIESLAPRWDAYFRGEVLALVVGGRRPPLLEGFERFLANAPWRTDVATMVRRAERRAPREHDTHPSLEERLEALGVRRRDPRVAQLREARGARTARAGRAGDEGRALELLDAPRTAEADALSTILRDDAPPLADTAWDRIAEDGWLPTWRKSLAPLRNALLGIAVEDIPDAIDDATATWRALHPGVLMLLSPLGTRRSVAETLGLYLTLVCADAGWTIEVPPGGETAATKDGQRLEPELLVRELAEGKILEDEFLERVRSAGLAKRKGFSLEAAPAKAAPAQAASAAPADAEEDGGDGDASDDDDE